MLRTAIQPRNLALLALAVVVMIGFGQLGRWQLGVAEDKASREALEQARAQKTAPVEEVLTPHTEFPPEAGTRPVTATGEFGTDQVIVANRFLDDREGYWVVAPLRVASTGATLPVLRGFVRAPQDAPPVPAGEVVVEGGLAPPESPYQGDPVPAGTMGSIDTSVLVGRWDGALYNAFVFQEAESPASPTETVAGLSRVPVPVDGAGFQWRNAAYALQWWVFAVFAGYMWWRIVREDRTRAQWQA